MNGELTMNYERIMNVNTSKSGSSPTVPMAARAVRKCAAALGGVLSGAPVGAVVLLVAGAARPRGLMVRVMVRPSTAPSHKASCPRSYTPPKNGFPLWVALQFAARALQFHPPFFLLVEEASFPMGPPHQGTAGAH